MKIPKLFQSKWKPDHDERLIKHKVDGNTFYVFRDVRMLPISRKQIYCAALADLSEKISHVDIGIFCKTVRDLGNKGDMAGILQLTGYLETQLILEERAKPHYQIAMAAVLVEGENPDEPHSWAMEQKMHLAQKSEQVRDFFLTISLNFNTSSEKQWTTSQCLEYLKAKGPRSIEEAFYKSLGTDIYNASIPK